MALAVPRSGVGNQLATMRALAGKDGASAKPTMTRSITMLIHTGMKASAPAKACRKVKIDHRKMAHRYTVREPKRSSSAPPGTCAAA